MVLSFFSCHKLPLKNDQQTTAGHMSDARCTQIQLLYISYLKTVKVFKDIVVCMFLSGCSGEQRKRLPFSRICSATSGHAPTDTHLFVGDANQTFGRLLSSTNHASFRRGPCHHHLKKQEDDSSVQRLLRRPREVQDHHHVKKTEKDLVVFCSTHIIHF